MAGIFGGVGLTREQMEELAHHHRRRWAGCDVVSGPGFVVGGEGPGDGASVSRTGRRWIAVDGERAAGTVAREDAGGDGRSPVVDERGVPTVAATVAMGDPGTGEVRLAADWSGAFPVHWISRGEAFAFSTLPDALAAVFGAPVDPAGVVAFVKDGYYPGPRTCFEGVRRVQAGQVVRFDPETAAVDVEETSRAWSGRVDDRAPDATGEALWSAIRSSVDRSFPEGDPAGVMLSAGWDSRTLLAAAVSCRDRSSLRGLSHGDTESRELDIVAGLCEEEEVPCRLRPFAPREFAPDNLGSIHRRCGTAQFPYWRESARALVASGAACVSAGIFGEVAGGHYGPAMFMTGGSKMYTVLRDLLAGDGAARDADVGPGAVRDLLVRGVRTVERFFRPGFWEGHGDLPSAYTAAVEDELRRLRRRGVRGAPRLAEAYLTEHRGGQYINAQLRTGRLEGPIAVPFAHREPLVRASRIPFRVKIHNRLNRRMLARAAPSFLDPPLAAVLVPASYPLVVQEATRAARKAWEETRWWLHDATRGRLAPPRLSWIDFGFLTGTDHLHELVADLRWEGWNRGSIRDLADSVRSGSWGGSLHEPVLQLLKLYSLDLDLRRSGV